MTELNIDKIRIGAELCMLESVRGNDHLAYAYARWIKEYCQEILYEDMYNLGLDGAHN